MLFKCDGRRSRFTIEGELQMMNKGRGARWWGRRHTAPRARPTVTLHLERLEDRLAPAVAFGKSDLLGASLTNPTSLQFGPDGRLYVAEQGGLIKAFSVTRNAANSYTATATETISLVHDIPNHNDDGALNTNVVGRQVTGILVTGTAANPVLYVTSSDPRSGGGAAGTDSNLDTNSGILSRLTWTGSTWVKLDLVRGLPRSEENHSSNGLALDPATNTLYIAQGGNTNMGAPSNNFALLPEYALSAAILSVNLTAIGNTTYDLPTLDDENRPGTADANDPFGGDNGKNQAMLVPGGPVQVYSSGYRNPYDVVLTQSGRLYTIDNGSNAGWGDVPLGPNGQPTTAATAGTATNAVHEPGVTNSDQLQLVTQGFYAGHPNPTRANLANTFNTSNPQSPVSTADPVEGYFRQVGTEDGALTLFSASTDGLTEYTANNFGGEMKGDLLAASFDNAIHRIKLDATGTSVVSNTTLFSNVGSIPLDVTTGTGALAGTIWVADYQLGSVIVFEPTDLVGTGADDPTLDDDGDHYNNHDEIANGTNPLSPADVPHDWDKDFLSDKLDTDDDNDGLPDNADPYAIDAANGRSTPIPVNYPWDNATPYPGGLLNLGFTGLMTNKSSYYDQLFDPAKLTAGGAAGALTIDSVTAGTAKGAANNQDYGFQFGIDATPSTPPFVAHTRVKGPFAGLTPQAGQQIGLQFGTGDQDNYVELAIDGDGSVKLMKEVGGSWSLIASAPLTLSGLTAVDLYLTVDSTGTIQGSFTTTANGVTGAQTVVGTTSFPTAWLSGAAGPAVGLMTTTGGGPSFPATYDLMEVRYTWSAGANMPVVLGEVAGGVINGKLYLVGEGNSATLAYDLATNTWTSGLAPRPFAGDHHAAEVINGKLYLFGGLGGGSEGKVQIYDPATNTWSLGADMPFAAGSSASAVIGGQVYVAGGIVGTSTTSQAARYNPATNTWSPIASMPQARNHAASATDGTKLYVFGGRGPGSGDANVVANGFDTVEVYDPVTNTWASSLDPGSTIPPLPQARGGMGKAVFFDGEFYVMGGETLTGAGATSNGVYDRVDIYSPATQTWRIGAPMPTALHGIFPLLATTTQGGTRIYVAGGGPHSGQATSIGLQSFLLAPPPAPPPAVPAAPSGLTAQWALPTRVLLNWQDNSSSETSFVVERKTGTGAYAVLATLGAGVISYTDVTAAVGTQYTYRVTATNQTGSSASSNEATVTPGQSPHGGTAWAVPGLIQAEDFDDGGEGVAYHDTDAVNEGGAYRSTGVDLEPTSDTGGGTNVGYVRAGEWLEYTVNVATAGAYTLDLRVASLGPGGAMHVEAGGANLTGSLTIPDTGGWQSWQTLSVPVQLSAGQQVLRVAFDSVGASGYTGNLNWLRLTAVTSGLPAAPSGLAVVDSPTQVSLSWQDNSSNETNFVVERKTGTGAYAVLATLGAGATSYSDTTAQASTQYSYRVKATSAAGSSAYSNEVPLTTSAAEVTINDVSKLEGNGKGTTSFTFTVTLSRPSSQTVTVQYATADGTATASSGDYIATSGALTFTAGQTTKTVTVQVKRDRVREPDETFFVNLTSAVNGVLKKQQGIGTILNDD
jgi:N-acetylneuraminic acid mutarotase